jgi:ribosome-associated heat shock protein Hsp15
MTLGRRLLVWRILSAATRRGPPAEAATLYDDMTPDLPRDDLPRD